MKRLLLLRHAKAARLDAHGDHERPLAPRGIWAAERMAEHCAPQLGQVDAALCSSAIRARETLRVFEQYLPPSCKITQDEALTVAEGRGLFEALKATRGGGDVVLLVGHEPALSDLADLLCGDAGGSKAMRRLAKGLKTSSLVTIDLEIDAWSKLRSGVGRLRAMVRPKDLR